LRSAVDYLQYVNLILYTLVAVVAVRQWRRHREEAAIWAALTFVSLALVVDVGPLLPQAEETRWADVARRLLVATLALFPYLLYRFAVAFRPPSRPLSLVVSTVTAVVLASTFVVPEIPREGEPWPNTWRAYVIAFTVHWTLLAIVVMYRLWTAGRGEPSVARRRMQVLALAAAAITLALIIAAVGDQDSRTDAVTNALSTFSALGFLLGLKPPPLLRIAWRRPEQERLQAAVASLVQATTEAEVIERVLPPMAKIVGARGLELRSSSDIVLGRHGEPEAANGRLTSVALEGGGELRVWTSPYAPFFGGEEMRLLRTLAALTALALDRSRLFAQERDARLALERADEIKTNFVALAAHELRTPAATVHGLVETIYVRRDELSETQLRELEEALREQTARLRRLVDQLLDMSRLDAEAVKIEPEPLKIRERVEEVLALNAGERAPDVTVDVPGELQAKVDSAAFERILSNLIVNALRYGEPPVKVSAHQTDRHFRLTVEDSGEGVAPEFVPNLFDRFTRGAPATRRVGGTGLGLAIARSYARAHDGDLIYEPAHPRGARFQFVLPVRNGSNARS
jgi:signal transduction histidine kinase